MTAINVDAQRPGRQREWTRANLVAANPGDDSRGGEHTPTEYTLPRSPVILHSPPPISPVIVSSDSLGPESSHRRPVQPHQSLSSARQVRPTTGHTIVAVTRDTHNYVVVDLTGQTEAQEIRKYILFKLQIPDDLHSKFSIYRTELDASAIGDSLDDPQLLFACQRFGDDRATLKFLARRSDTPTDGDSNLPTPTPKIASVPPMLPPFSSLGWSLDLDSH